MALVKAVRSSFSRLTSEKLVGIAKVGLVGAGGGADFRMFDVGLVGVGLSKMAGTSTSN